MPKGGELMAEEVFVPKYGQTVEEVTIVQWMVEDGAQVKKGQELLEIETDKTTFMVEAEVSGFLHRGPFKAGDVVPVLTVIAVIGKPEDRYVAGVFGAAPIEATHEAAPATATTAEVVNATEETGERAFASPRARRVAEEKNVDLRLVSPTGGNGARITEKDVLAYLAAAPKATPVAQKLAAEAGVNLRAISGTGPGGRITKEDVEGAIKPATLAPEPVAVAQASSAPKAVPLPEADVVERIPLKGVRGIIADRMGTSVHTTARVTLLMDVDATEFVAIRERLKAKVADEWGFAPGYNDLLGKIIAVSLRKYPYMNARLSSDAIEILGHVNLGMAVDTERGLLVPVVRDADRKSLHQFGAEFREMVNRARAGKSLPEDITGGTFTMTNLGMFDIEGFTPIINLPEAAILGVGRIIPKWVYREESPNAPVLRQMMTLSLVFDHRVVDGAPAARFLQHIKHLVEEPYLLLAE
jgi:pyruvate dehydrogenase E2 component (dihydrolipoamide acetyltransferase)